MAYWPFTVEPIRHLQLGRFATDLVICIVNIINLYQSNKLQSSVDLSTQIKQIMNIRSQLQLLSVVTASTIIVIKTLLKAYSHLCLHPYRNYQAYLINKLERFCLSEKYPRSLEAPLVQNSTWRGKSNPSLVQVSVTNGPREVCVRRRRGLSGEEPRSGVGVVIHLFVGSTPQTLYILFNLEICLIKC